MNVVGIGTDITRISRIHRLLSKDYQRFTRKSLHPDERQELVNTIRKSKPNKETLRFHELSLDIQLQLAQFTATRWAMKESIYKAVDFKFSFNQVCIFKVSKKPMVVFENLKVLVSVSHDGDLVVASAIAFK
jgi:phosphopantetheine--protein transferase-like protein